MGRFFSRQSLNRYRRLARDELAALERNRILQALTEQWESFMRDCRGPTVHPCSTLARAVRTSNQRNRDGASDGPSRPEGNDRR